MTPPQTAPAEVDQDAPVHLTGLAVFQLLLDTLWETNRLTAAEVEKWERLYQGAQ